MRPLPVAHIGLLVADLAESRDRWQTVMGLPFSPISRYRPDNWSDRGDPRPHLHDARLSFYLGDRPSIELLEFVGTGTHSREKGEGGHHLSFPPIADNAARRSELEALGVGIDGEIMHEGRWIFQFSDPRALNNVYTEWVEEHPAHPDVKDDLSPVDRLPDGSKTLFEVETILRCEGQRPASRITEIGVAVFDLAKAVDRWRAVIGYGFELKPGGTAVGGEAGLLIRLIQADAEDSEGLRYAIVNEPDIENALDRLREDGVPIARVISNLEGKVERVDVDPAYLNGFGIRFQRPARATS